MNVNSNKCKINSILVAIFLAETNICAIISNIVPIDNIAVILMAAIIMFSILINRNIKLKISFVMAFAAILLSLCISIILNGTLYTTNYLLHFILFGLTAMILLSHELNYQIIMIYISAIYLIYTISYFVFDRNSFLSSPNYWEMQMGIAYAFVPIILISVAILLYWDLFKERKLFFWVIMFNLFLSIYVILFDCGTRGALITVVLGTVLFFLGKMSKKKMIFVLFICGVACVLVIYNIDSILEYLLSVEWINRIPSLSKFIRQFQYSDITSGRSELYASAWELIKLRPIIGYGVGYFELHNAGLYIHQLFIEIFFDFGLIGLIALCSILVKDVIAYFKSPLSYRKIFHAYLFSISIFVLLISNSFWLLPQFWLYFFFALQSKGKSKS